MSSWKHKHTGTDGEKFTIEGVNVSIVASEYQSSKLNVNFLASKMNMSRTNFYRKLISVTDISPKDFTTKYRINKSLELLKDGNENFGEISHLCGFGS